MNPGSGVADSPVGRFLDAAGRSRLVPPARLRELLAAAPPAVRGSARAFADHLVRAGALTPFQADKLLAGFWQGLVLGPYRVLAPAGRGGMGVVYRAESAERGPVALKILPPRRAREEPRTLARFLREMELGRRVPPHPNLAAVLAAGEVGGVHYLAMEFVPGRTLKRHILDHGSLPVAEAAGLFADVASGLAHVHAHGLVHRDLKPSNVMVTPGGRAKLLDLGFALAVGGTADGEGGAGGPGYTLGTMDYIAPEQVRDPAAVGPPADVYSLGCSLYFALTGSPPFPGGTSAQKIRWHRTDDPPPVRSINPAVPDDAAAFVDRLMAKDAAARPQSAAEVRDRLLAWAPPRPQAPPVAVTAFERVAGTDGPEGDGPIILDDEPFEVVEAVPADSGRVAVLTVAAVGAGVIALLTAALAAAFDRRPAGCYHACVTPRTPPRPRAMTRLSYYKRHRMAVGLNPPPPPAVLPPGYFWQPWADSLLDLFADALYASFRLELDCEVFPNLGRPAGCRDMLRAIRSRDGFCPEATWLVGGPDGFVGTVQGMLDPDGVGSVQNVGVVHGHRRLGIGTALLFRALHGFRERGAARAYLEVTGRNLPAVRLYRRRGFRHEKTLYRTVELPPPVPVGAGI